MSTPRVGFVATAIAVVALSGCGSSVGGTSDGAAPTGATRPSIAIAALETPFETALAHIYAAGLRSSGYEVEVVDDHATLEDAAPALRSGEIDLVHATLDDAIALLYDLTPPEKADRAFQTLKAEAEKDGISTLDYTPGARTAQFVMPRDLAEQVGVAKMSELEQKVPQQLTLAGPETCEERRNCYEGLRTTYQLLTLEFLPTDDGGDETFAALESGQANLGYVYTTWHDRIEQAHLVPLEDDAKVTGPGEIVPLAARALVEAGDEQLVDDVGAISELLTGDALTELEHQLASGDPQEVAETWAREHGLVEEG